MPENGGTLSCKRYAAQKVIKRSVEVLADAGKRVAFCCGVGLESMVIADLIGKLKVEDPGFSLDIFTIDTQKLFPGTEELFTILEMRYNITITRHVPDPDAVRAMVEEHGEDLYLKNTDLADLCCKIRKVDVLEKALKGYAAWITGLRRDASPTRRHLIMFVKEPGRAAVKISPLVEWSRTDVIEYLRDHNVPHHPLYRKGYMSIGCEPCTGPSTSDDERSGRWPQFSGKKIECGMHRPPVPR